MKFIGISMLSGDLPAAYQRQIGPGQDCKDCFRQKTAIKFEGWFLRSLNEMKRIAAYFGILILGAAIGGYAVYLASRYALCVQPNVVYFRHYGPPMPSHFPDACYAAGVKVTNHGFTVLIKQAPSVLDGFDKQVLSVDTQRNSACLTTFLSWPSPATNTLDLVVHLSEIRSDRATFLCQGTWPDKNEFTNSVDVYGIVPLPFRSIPEWKQNLHSQILYLYERTWINE